MRLKFFIAIAFTAGCLLLLHSCSSPGTQEPQNTTPETAPVVGGDSDEHGCKASAGYQWSVVRNECIRTFEAGIRLDPQADGLDKTLSAFVVFKSDEDDAQAELFMPGQNSTILLDKVPAKDDAGTWKNATLTLSQWKGMYTLEDANKKTLYQGPATR